MGNTPEQPDERDDESREGTWTASGPSCEPESTGNSGNLTTSAILLWQHNLHKEVAGFGAASWNKACSVGSSGVPHFHLPHNVQAPDALKWNLPWWLCITPVPGRKEEVGRCWWIWVMLPGAFSRALWACSCYMSHRGPQEQPLKDGAGVRNQAQRCANLRKRRRSHSF